MGGVRVGVVGATGLVGRMILQVLAERDFPVADLRAFASARSAGGVVPFAGEDVPVVELADGFARHLDIVFSSAGSDVSRRFLPQVRGTDAVAIDNTSAFRMDPAVPLVVPEVNPEDATSHTGIIANPNCSTIQAVVALAPLVRAFGGRRIVYSTYQAVSGSGTKGLRDLDEGLAEFYPRQIRGNVIPQIGDVTASGYTDEELKMVNETRKILHLSGLRVSATTVRVPVRIGHAVAVNLECEKPVTLDAAMAALAEAPGVVLAADAAGFPTPLEVEGRDEVFVGRVRIDPSLEHGLELWTVADNVRKGAATNAVQVGELLVGAR